jgi:hypothetical protein
MPDDVLSLTIRLYDPAEKQDVKRSACWVTIPMPREALTMSKSDFLETIIAPALSKLVILKLT